MTRIQSSVGLITGIPIEETVKKLMTIAARPRDLLVQRTQALGQQQAALDTLGSRLLAFQFAVNRLNAGSVYALREATSSNTDVLQVAIGAGATPSPGSFQVRAIRAASSHQIVTQPFAASDASLGEGVISFRVGGFVDTSISLEALNGGAGVPRGKIKITDRSGASATIDLTHARSVDDVLDAINSNGQIAVTAGTQGDRFTLTDASGGAGNLTVAEVGVGTTAASLGLAGISAASDHAVGGDVFRLHSGSKLNTLNDGNGVQIRGAGIPDLVVELSDGTSLSIDLAGAATLGDVIDKVNAASPAKLSASIAPDGARLRLDDLSGGAGVFSVESGVSGTAAEDLGLTAAAAGGIITGRRLAAGLRDTLLTSLQGGKGFDALGVISITDRDGGADSVDLASAETLSDVIDLLNGSSAEVTASINAARNGILIADVSGGTGNLVVADADATNSATALGVAIDAGASSVNSGGLHRQTLSEATLLSSLNGGKGVSLGDLRITDSSGAQQTADLNTVGSEAKTVGDVLRAINALSIGVEARINDSGDGILIVDSAQGSGLLGVQDVGSGTVAKSLNLTRQSQTIEVGGEDVQAIDGTVSHSIDLADLDVSAGATPLSSLNGGKGIAFGDILITDSAGKTIALDLNGADGGVSSVGQLIDLINQKAQNQGVGVAARLNDAGSGILLEDTAGGAEKLKVEDVNSTAAADLKIVGEAQLVGGVQTINGAGAFSPATTSTANGLSALAAKINSLKAGVTAGTVFDGVGYRLAFSVDASGAANELLIDAGGSLLTFTETNSAQDALLEYGGSGTTGGLLLGSSTNSFVGAVNGLDLTISQASEAPVTVTVKQTNAGLIDVFEEVVEAYNALRSDLDKLTAFDADAATTGLLFGTNEALQIDSRLSRVLTDRFTSAGSHTTLASVGLRVKEDGTLELNKTRLTAAFEADPAAVEQFLAAPNSGVAAKISATIDQLAGTDNSLLAARSDSIQDTIAANEDRIARFALQLERQQERLLLQFYQLEQVVARMQTSLSALQNLQVIPPLGS